MNEFAQKVLALATSQVGVRETSRNTSPEIAGYCRDIGWPERGLHPENGPDSWCAIFVCAMVKRACQALGLAVPFHLTAGCFTLEEKFPAAAKTLVPVAGSIFIKKGHEHTGLVAEVHGTETMLVTIEGNTNAGGSANGDGVYRRTRHIDDVSVYLDLSKLPLVSGVA